MAEIDGRRIVLGVCGSVAAFKAAALATELTKSGAVVRVILTASGEKFVGVETFRDLTGQPVATSMWDAEMDHIELAYWADLVIVAPATANLVAKMAIGLADDLLSTVLLATPVPILLAPAMESRMWEHPATQANVKTLVERGVALIGPTSGRLASGSTGAGRMIEPHEIVEAARAILTGKQTESSDLAGIDILITAGPTQEPIDPVRFISNRSSGKMGYQLAMAAANRGATVHLVSGPVDSSLAASLPIGIHVTRVNTASEMLDALNQRLEHTDVVIMAAAVADYAVSQVHDEKIKKADSGGISLDLEPTSDILRSIGADASRGLVLIGFAAETENLIEHARTKLDEKNLDMIVANDVSGANGGVFGSDDNEVVIIRAETEPERVARMPKRDVANRILDHLPEILAWKKTRA